MFWLSTRFKEGDLVAFKGWKEAEGLAVYVGPWSPNAGETCIIFRTDGTATVAHDSWLVLVSSIDAAVKDGPA